MRIPRFHRKQMIINLIGFCDCAHNVNNVICSVIKNSNVFTCRDVTGLESPGICATLNDSLKCSLHELEERDHILPPEPDDGSFTKLQFIIKDGMDGAGNQLKIKGQSSSTMELMGYVVLKVVDISDPVRMNR